ncbi:hypothetical protein PG987_013431 [Apiospora arundinis]
MEIRAPRSVPDASSTTRSASPKTGPWKAPGEDLLPTGLLKAYGDPIYRALAGLEPVRMRTHTRVASALHAS